jgi:ferredoxin
MKPSENSKSVLNNHSSTSIIRWKILKTTRVVISLLFFIGLLVLYLVAPIVPDSGFFGETLSSVLIYPQVIPSVIAFKNILFGADLGWLFWGSTGFMLILLMTLFFGRLYCSSVCPLGTWFDAVSWLKNRMTEKRPLLFIKSHTWIGYLILGATLVVAVGGNLVLVSFLDPFGIFGRAMADLWSAPILLALFSLLFFLFLTTMAWYKERWYCTVICPVGILLGLVSRISFLRITIHPATCTKCGNCTQICKSHCIDYEQYKVDFERCVGCLNCLTVCEDQAMTWKGLGQKAGKNPIQSKNPEQPFDGIETTAENEIAFSRRNFLGTMMVFSAATTLSGFLPASKLLAQNNPETSVEFYPALPPGTQRAKRYAETCISCHLCVSICPTGVLVPAFWDSTTKGWMQPKMDFTRGFCDDTCHACTRICPTDAIQPLTLKEKQSVQIGVAVLVKNLCIPVSEREPCAKCAEVCPTDAIKLNPYLRDLLLPEILQDQCTGCGACVTICPVRPDRALYIESFPVHKQINRND